MAKPSSDTKRNGWLKWSLLGLLVLIAVTAVVLFDVKALLNSALDWIESLGVWAPVLFVLVYVVAATLLIPGSALTLGAGALFGVIQGSLMVSIASTLAATVAFLIGRYLARDAISRKVEGNARFDAVDRAVADQGWKIVLLTRLSPVFPYTLLNYAFGLTRVQLGHYVLASWVGMMPGTVMYVYIGSIANAASGEKSLGEWIFYGAGLAATLVVTVLVTRVARQALARQIENNPSSA
jgi:uncharacterized membrane protein YdjX (TVP38/TMEM64 family)